MTEDSVLHPAVPNLPSTTHVQRTRRWAPMWLKLFIGGTLCIALLSQIDITAAATALQRVHPLLIALLLGCMALNVVLSATKWRIILAIHGVRVPLGYLNKVYLIASFFNNFLPTSIGGDGYRIFKTIPLCGSRVVAIFAVFAERFTGIIALLTLAVLASTVSLLRAIDRVSLTVLIVSLAAFFILVLLAETGLVARLVVRVGQRDRLQALRRCFLDYRQHAAKTFAVLLISMGFHVFTVAWLAFLLGAIGEVVPLHHLVLAWTATGIDALLPLSINGLGIQDASLALTLYYYGADYSAAVFVAFLVRVLLLPIAVLGGILYLVESTR